MSTTRGIFESFPNQPATRQDSPFAVVPEPAAPVAASPFTAVARQESPFTVMDEVSGLAVCGLRPWTKLPERRKTDSPFQVAEPSEGFGYRGTSQGVFRRTVRGSRRLPQPVAASPFSVAPQQPAASPFSVEPNARGPSPSTQAAIAAFGNWQEPPATPAPQSFIGTGPGILATGHASAFAPASRLPPFRHRRHSPPHPQNAPAAADTSKRPSRIPTRSASLSCARSSAWIVK